MRKNIKIKYNQLLFLYAYLRLIDLSLDRSRWNGWKELQNYFKTILRPYPVIQYLMNSFNLSKSDCEKLNLSIEKKSKLNRLKVFFKKLSLEKDNIIYCYKLISYFDKILNSDKESYDVECEKLRIDIAKYYSDVLGKMILWKDLDKLMIIEHFWQNENFDHLKLDELIPEDFPAKTNDSIRS